MLQFCTAQKPNATPLTFSNGVNVYTLEEALYYLYHHWQEVTFDIKKITAWFNETGLYFIAEKAGDTLVELLQVIDYFTPGEIAHIAANIQAWENRTQLEKLKHEADQLTATGNPAQAIHIYKQLLNLGRTVPLLNNIATAYMRYHMPYKALPYLQEAVNQAPDNVQVARNLQTCEGLIANPPQPPTVNEKDTKKDTDNLRQYQQKLETWLQQSIHDYWLAERNVSSTS